jgi:hypothetical protein
VARPAPVTEKPKTDAGKPAGGTARYYPLDFVAAVALLIGTILGGRAVFRTLGFAPALFFFLVGFGLSYHYFRGAWNALRRSKQNPRRSP